jgi:ribonuclease HII
MAAREDPKDKYKRLSEYEEQARADGHTLPAGIDEAGRGPLAGPVVAAACILSPDRPIFGLDDSKKLSEKKREALYIEIKEKAVAYAVVRIENDVIDDINILEATKHAMRSCVAGLPVKPDCLLIDAVRLTGVDVPVIPIIKGDAKSNSIAAASILAKVTRDHIMMQYDEEFPGYDFSQHKGYGTKAHYEAIHKLGFSPIHRRTFLTNLHYEEEKS